MKPRICVCCGESMTEAGNALSRNPNICASCSSMADGMYEENLPPAAIEAQIESPQAATLETRSVKIIQPAPIKD